MASHHKTHVHELTDCIDTCVACYETCERMIYQHCLEKGGKHAEPQHLLLMADCAQMCRTAAGFMIRGSPRHPLACRACAEICDACADDCEHVGEMDECVLICRNCAASCREMAGAA